jgi:alkylation response protein AidB-like acyl-CoA dehydrogenase
VLPLRQVFFNETQVPVENMLLSERGNGFKVAMNAGGRIKLAAACLDAQRRDFWCSAIC